MENQNSKTLVLVTGGSGFIAVHCILKLLQQGYKVRTTLRSDIYLELGFEDLSHFSFAFKKLYGISPNQVKKGSI